MKKLFSATLIITLFTFFGNTVCGQTNDITLSTEKVIISGKKYYMHIVDKGQTAFGISKAYNILLNELAEENSGVFDGLSIGQQLKVPIINGRNNTVDEIKYADKFSFHYIEKGQTLYSLAKYYETDIKTILKWNPDAEHILLSGQVLRIPKKGVDVEQLNNIFFTDSDTLNDKDDIAVNNEELNDNPVVEIDELEVIVRKTKYFIEHTVRKGETLYSLSRKYKVTKEEIAKYNDDVKNSLSIGRVLQMPVYGELEIEDVVDEPKDAFKREDSQYYYHIVEKSETLNSIAKFYNLKAKKITKKNRELKERDVIEGEMIRIPKRYIKDISLVARMVKERFSQSSVTEVIDEPIVILSSDSIFPCVGYNYADDGRVLKIALMLPFYLYENDTLAKSQVLRELNSKKEKINVAFIDEPEIVLYKSSRIFLEFYEGFLIAIDSMKRAGLKIDLHVFDTEKNIDTVRSILSNTEMKNMDLIVGPVFKKNVNAVAAFAELYNIPFISPLISSKIHGTLPTSKSFQIVPSVETQIKEFSDVISNYYNKNIVIIHFGTEKEKRIVKLYEKYLLPSLYAKSDSALIHFKVVQLDPLKAFDVIKPTKDDDEKEIISYPIKKYLTDTIPNLIIIPSKTRGLISNTIRQLTTLQKEVITDFEITMCGFSNAQKFDNIDISNLHDLEYHTFLTSWVDYDRQEVKDFIFDYRKNFKTEPTQFSFQGYDIAFFYLNILKTYGPDFSNCLSPTIGDSIFSCLQNEFKFYRTSWGGYENNQVFVIKYDQDYDVVRIDEMYRELFNTMVREVKIVKPNRKEMREVKKEKEQDTNRLRLYRKPRQ